MLLNPIPDGGLENQDMLGGGKFVPPAVIKKIGLQKKFPKNDKIYIF